VIGGAHVLVYADDAPAARAFFRDVLGWENVDDGGGWLIFALPPSELGVHPTEDAGRASGATDLFLMCRDLEVTIEGLRAKGVECPPPADRGFGRVTTIPVPGLGPVGLYQPNHASPLGELP
jgi:catechol 2,3-dioxygenase-like lactoylglutathione lyase family enzyme